MGTRALGGPVGMGGVRLPYGEAVSLFLRLVVGVGRLSWRVAWRVAWRAVVTLVRHPVVSLWAGVAVWVWLRFGLLGPLLAGTALAAVFWGWRRLRPRSFRRMMVSPWRRVWIYRRHWQPAMVMSGLAKRHGESEYLPRLRRVVSGSCVDRVLVGLLAGQAPEDLDAKTSQLAHTFGALRCRVVVARPGRVWLEFTYRDPLSATIPALEPDPAPDLMGLPIGRAEDGSLWRLRLLGMHLLIAGATGSGKGSVLGSLFRALGPAIRDGLVELWAIDPKGGMEFSPSAPLFARFAYDEPERMVELLEDAVAYMRARAERLRLAGIRLHEPIPGDPLVVVVVDELAALTAYGGDRELKRRADSALRLLLSQGRAPGVLVVAALQDPGKDVLPYRDLFPTRIALRLLEDVQVDMVLGRSARLHGAECDRIPVALPGVGYIIVEGRREPVRVRAAFVSDEDLGDTIERYAGPVPRAPEPLHLVMG